MSLHELYQQNILEHYKNPLHRGILEPCDRCAHAKNVSCGDDLTLYMNIDNEKVTDISFAGNGCAISIAGASMLTHKLHGMSLRDIRQLEEEDVFALFGIPIGPARAKCALLAYSALQEILNPHE